MLSEQPYHYLTVDEMKGLGDDSLPIDVTRDERDNRDMGENVSFLTFFFSKLVPSLSEQRISFTVNLRKTVLPSRCTPYFLIYHPFLAVWLSV